MERERERREPTVEEVQATGLYFGELEDALIHYASSLPEGSHLTLTVRSDENGEPNVELVSGTRFPPLDDLPTHFDRLKYVAGELDHIPVQFWNDFYSKQLKGSRDIPHVPMQIVLWGTGNDGMRNFRREALLFEAVLGDFSWATSRNPDSERDHAEQCKRIIYAYTVLKDNVPDHTQRK